MSVFPIWKIKLLSNFEHMLREKPTSNEIYSCNICFNLMDILRLIYKRFIVVYIATKCAFFFFFFWDFDYIIESKSNAD